MLNYIKLCDSFPNKTERECTLAKGDDAKLTPRHMIMLIVEQNDSSH